MKVCNLASGSKGNATYIETKDGKFLFDAGKNIKYLTLKLSEIGVNITDIDFIIISHSHIDHVSSLTALLKKTKATLCVTEKIFFDLKNLKDYEHVLIFDNVLQLNKTTIISFKSSHDTEDSRNFIIEEDDKKVAYITDTGYLNRKYFKLLSNCNLYLFESNHDIEMLRKGPYPDWLKQRVLSDKGHLSNNSAGIYLSKLIGKDTKEIMLIHLSEINNTPQMALETVYNTLKEYDFDFQNINCAKQDERSEVINI